MIHGTFYVDVYEWKIEVYIIEYKHDVNKFKKKIKYKPQNCEHIDELIQGIQKGHMDGGVTISYGDKTSIIYLYPSTSVWAMLGTLLHEKRHVEDFIIKHLHIDGDEATAYLAGYIGKQIMEMALKENFIQKISKL